ncbi:protein phosphatase methylesterase 1 [Histomonas meleagridis]|uniref:protein phosphatase methylesterase 1 n=1 Tax=Histomonas meleagridis TaxID=135588 RepID=UPI003559C7B6|nr:protein phosphatase methylesterase 1 [Histomonas meleagridis]KAH0806991.1 protein phosphatase methylesterase 1 [Histomonas meleagridis]
MKFSFEIMSFSPWSDYWEEKKMIIVPGRGEFNTYCTIRNSPYCLVCVHGAGHSALSFSVFAKMLNGAHTIYAYDLKAHGDTPGDPSTDLTIESLTQDLIEFCKVVQPPNTHLIVIGHSLGGSIGARAALTHHMNALVVIDTIEGNIVESIPQMKKALLCRPQIFNTPAEAIEFISTCGELQNYQSAQVSAAGRLKEVDGHYEWRTDLLKCESQWAEWFKGFADAFLNCKPYKVLVLPDINRLDTPFTIGHMTGKFQLEVILNTYHCVHEDEPKKFTEMINRLIKRLGSTTQWD